ncbi:type-F conjugative transfer system pilin assembly protein TrbC [Algicola sagamiensis]|uniref:type-F conjugative transfer system pilin assembly protein TrbC n=1 Tax=Algicola sagamiensis TaxID=163869 RepID=UPI000381521D|nr:type-F conjugative transfer system pilin assembly protein TrbC [Algicola sagamiensis]
MLRILIILMLLPVVSVASDEVNKATKELLKQSEDLMQSKEFNDWLQKSRSSMGSTDTDTKQVFQQLDELLDSQDFQEQLSSEKKKIESMTTTTGNRGNSFYHLDRIQPSLDKQHLKTNEDVRHSKFSNLDKRRSVSTPVILVSLSMPKSQLKSLMTEAAKLKSKVVLRGVIDNDIKKTIQVINSFSNQYQQGGISIDPTLFTRFEVQQVPTFILPIEPIQACTKSGCPIPQHVKAYGTASLEYFLEKVSRLGNSSEKQVAEYWLEKGKEG